jgi:hypothetical protein
MKKAMLYGLGLVLAAPLFAQGAIYSPKDLASTEGQYYGYYFFRYSEPRWQQCDGENRGKVAVIASIAVRLDGTYNYNTSYGMGRTWSNVQLMISEGDLNNFTATFSTNATTTPTTVFSAGWSLPTVSGVQSPQPQPWGGSKGELKLPFKSTWIYTGKGDILTDWQYTGGTLANNSTWTGSTTRYYMIDSYGSANEYSSVSGSIQYIPSTRLNNNSTGVTTRCNDSEHGTSTSGAYAYLYTAVYGNKYPVDNYRGNLYTYFYSYYTGYENPVIHGLALSNNTAGVDLGTGCNKLHLVAPIVAVPRVTMPSSYSTSGYSGYKFSWIKWQNGFASVKVTVQAAWADSSTNAFALSQAVENTLPSGPPGPAPMRMAIYNYNKTSATGSGPYNYYYMNPAFCYSTSK